MKLPCSLRARLLLVFTVLSAVGVLAAAVAMAVLVEHAVWAPLDAGLEEEAETLAGILDRGGAVDLARAVAVVGTESDFGPGKFVRVTRADGTVLAHSGNMPAELARAAPAGNGSGDAVRYLSVSVRGTPYRVVWHPAAGAGWAEIGVRAAAQVEAIARARAAIALTAAALLAALGLLAWRVTTRATSELERLASELETIEAGSLGRRLAPRHTAEVDRLAGVLNRLLARLEVAMEHLRRFTADAAHELRTPIAALRAKLEVALARGRSLEDYRDGLLDGLEQTERLTRLAEDLLVLSAIEVGRAGQASRQRTVRLDVLAREVADSVEPVAQEQGRNFTCRAAGPVLVRGDSHLLRRLDLNLLDNAFRHTPSGVPVELCVSGNHRGVATIEVSDRGPGIPLGERERVFERFYRGRSTGAGAGLGLALCREIALRHCGDIRLHSTPGTGTTVAVTLPAVA